MHPEQDLSWLAFCYLHDELSADEAQAFEDTLAVDQSAREALAEAMLLSHAVVLSQTVEPTVRVVRERGWRQAAPWVAVAVSACIAVLAVTDSWLSSPREGVRPVANQVNEGLALAWANSGVSLEPAMVDAELLAIEEADAATTEFESVSVTVPDWLLEAVANPPSVDAPSPSKES